MCSTPGDGPDRLNELGQAIDELADAAAGEAPDAAALATGLARAWRLMADLDPELGRRVARYDDTRSDGTGHDSTGHDSAGGGAETPGPNA